MEGFHRGERIDGRVGKDPKPHPNAIDPGLYPKINKKPSWGLVKYIIAKEVYQLHSTKYPHMRY